MATKLHLTAPLRFALIQKRNVMKAVVLRDMRTRFFNHGLGFLLVAIWPLCHLFALLLIAKFAGRTNPLGESMNVFLATGLIPTLAFMYVSRFMSYSLVLNRPLLAIPAVKILDVLFARAFLEITGACLTLLFIISLLTLLGENPVPHDLEQAVLAYMSVLLLAVGVGSLVGVMCMFFQFFVTLYALFLILIYISSGSLFVVSLMPSQLAYALSWSPVVQGVEWMREAYYETYHSQVLDKGYLLAWGLGSLCLGLSLERLLRHKMLE